MFLLCQLVVISIVAMSSSFQASRLWRPFQSNNSIIHFWWDRFLSYITISKPRKKQRPTSSLGYHNRANNLRVLLQQRAEHVRDFCGLEFFLKINHGGVKNVILLWLTSYCLAFNLPYYVFYSWYQSRSQGFLFTFYFQTYFFPTSTHIRK